jgi:hypothetical protein
MGDGQDGGATHRTHSRQVGLSSRFAGLAAASSLSQQVPEGRVDLLPGAPFVFLVRCG